MKYYAIPSNNSSVTEKHVVEDDILFTNPLAGKGLIILYPFISQIVIYYFSQDKVLNISWVKYQQHMVECQYEWKVLLYGQFIIKIFVMSSKETFKYKEH